MNRISKLLSVLAVASGLSLGALPASAATHTVSNNLESYAGWSLWASNASLGGGIYTTWANARSPSHIEYLYYSPATASDWLQFHRVFTTTVNPISCSASIYLHGNGAQNVGSVDMIDSATWTYIGTTSYNNVPNTGWTKITVTNSWPCTKSIALRVTLSASTTLSRQVYVDDASVSWVY